MIKPTIFFDSTLNHLNKIELIRKIANDIYNDLPPATYGSIQDRIKFLLELKSLQFPNQNDKAVLVDCMTLLAAENIIVSLSDGSGLNAKPVKLKAYEFVDKPKHIIRAAAREVRKQLNIGRETSGISKIKKKKRASFLIELEEKLHDPDKRSEIFSLIENEGWVVVKG